MYPLLRVRDIVVSAQVGGDVMGAWGGKLYQDDEALDIKENVKVLSKLPIDTSELWKLLASKCGITSSKDLSNPVFWLVIADQFERKGIRLNGVFENAIRIISDGIDIALQKELEMEDKDLKAREKDLLKLKDRLLNPRPEKNRSFKKIPSMVVRKGEIYSFPTAFAKSANPYFRSWEEEEFEQTGWGAFAVMGAERYYDYLPWIWVVLISVDPDKEPAINEILHSNLLGNEGSKSANYFQVGTLKALHLKRMKCKYLGSTNFNETTLDRIFKEENILERGNYAAINEISIANKLLTNRRYEGESISGNGIVQGCPFKDLIE